MRLAHICGSCEWVEFEFGIHVWVEYGALFYVSE